MNRLGTAVITITSTAVHVIVDLLRLGIPASALGIPSELYYIYVVITTYM